MTKTALSPGGIAPAVGPFSPAVEDGGLIFVSGQVAQDPATGKLIEGELAEQAHQIFRNLEQVLKSAGKTLDDALKVSVFLTDLRDFAAMNQVYAQYFHPPYPARTTIMVAGLPLGAKMEVDLIAR